MADSFEATFVREHAELVARYRRMADRAMVQFVIVRLGLVIGSATLPALTTLENRSWAIVAAVVVAALAGLDTQFQWGQEWQHFRSTEIALERLRREYLRQSEIIARKAADAERDAAAARNFDSFYQSTDRLLESETEKFWRFRITRWRADRPH